jgi:hypothetical protein
MRTRGSMSGRCSRSIRPQELPDSASGEPAKPSKPGFVGFVGALHGKCVNIWPRQNGPGRLLMWRPRIGARPIKSDLDCFKETTRLMSWSEPKTAAEKDCGGVVPAKAEA